MTGEPRDLAAILANVRADQRETVRSLWALLPADQRAILAAHLAKTPAERAAAQAAGIAAGEVRFGFDVYRAIMAAALPDAPQAAMDVAGAADAGAADLARIDALSRLQQRARVAVRGEGTAERDALIRAIFAETASPNLSRAARVAITQRRIAAQAQRERAAAAGQPKPATPMQAAVRLSAKQVSRIVAG